MRILFFTENFPPEVNAPLPAYTSAPATGFKLGTRRPRSSRRRPTSPRGVLFAGYENRIHQVEDMDGIRVVRVKTFIQREPRFLAADPRLHVVHGVRVPRRPVREAARRDASRARRSSSRPSEDGPSPRRAAFRSSSSSPISGLASIAAVGAMKRGAVLDVIEKVELFLYHRAAAIVALTAAFKRGPRFAGNRRRQDRRRHQRRGPSSRFQLESARRGAGGEARAHRSVRRRLRRHARDGARSLQRPRSRGRACATLTISVRFLLVGAGAERDRPSSRARPRSGSGNVVFVSRQPKEAMPSYWSLV